MATAYPIRFKRDDGTVSDISYLKECTMQQLLNAVKAHLTVDQFKHNTIQLYDTQLAIADDEDLEAAFDALVDTDSSDEDLIDIANTPPLVLTIVLTPKPVTAIIAEQKHTADASNDDNEEDKKKTLKPTTIIKKGDLLSHFIKPTTITDEEVTIMLSLSKPTEKTKSFYLHECGKEVNDAVAQYSVKKGEKEDYQDLDLDEFDQKAFSVALYGKAHDTNSISNALQITVPQDADVDESYVPPSVALEAVQAIEHVDQKEDNVYIYFGYPDTIRGEDITFIIQYVGDDAKGEDYVDNPLCIPKPSMPISFQIKISVTVDDVEYFSKLSDIITVDYLKLKPGMRTIIVEDTDTQLAQFYAQLVAVDQDDVSLRFDGPKATKKTHYYVHAVGKESEDRLLRMTFKKNTDHVVGKIEIDDAVDVATSNAIVVSVYNQQHDTDGLVSPLNIQLPTPKKDYTNTYEPDAVSVESIQAFKHEDHVYLYWQHPLSSFGSIKYKVMLHADDDHETQEVMVLPYKIPFSKLPVRVQIAVIFTIQSDEDDEAKVYESPLTEPVL
eukprot:424213_1